MNIKRIELIDLAYWDNVATPKIWKPLQATNGVSTYSLGPGSNFGIVLMDNTGSGIAPTPYEANLMWDFLIINDGSGVTDAWDIFGAAPLIPLTTKSIKIRYRLKVTDAAEPANIYAPLGYYYQIIKASYPADHITFGSGRTTGPWAPNITVYLPGISNTMVAGSAALHSWLTAMEHWQITWTRPDGSTKVMQPVSLSLTVADNSTAEYGGARAAISMLLPTLAIGQSGSHTLAVSLLPNDQDVSGGFFQFADGHTWTATITPLTPIIEDPLYISFDTNTYMSISFGT